MVDICILYVELLQFFPCVLRELEYRIKKKELTLTDMNLDSIDLIEDNILQLPMVVEYQQKIICGYIHLAFKSKSLMDKIMPHDIMVIILTFVNQHSTKYR